MKYPSYNLPLIYIPGVVEVGNDFIDESVFTVQVYSPTFFPLIVTVTPIIIGSVDISGTRYQSSSVILNVLSLTEYVAVVGGVFELYSRSLTCIDHVYHIVKVKVHSLKAHIHMLTSYIIYSLIDTV